MRNRVLVRVIVLLALPLMVAGCQLFDGGCEEGDLRVGMVSDATGLGDASLSRSVWEGLQKADEDLSVCAEFLESQFPTDYEKNIVELAEQDFALIVTVGPSLLDATVDMARRYPDTSFAIMGAAPETSMPNVQGAIFEMEEVLYPAGYLAAAWADLQDPDDAQVGYVGDVPSLEIEEGLAAFEAGVEYYNKEYGREVQVKGGDVGNVGTADRGWSQANFLLDEGVDVILDMSGQASHGGIMAAKERGKWAIGMEVDQYDALPNESDILLTSCLKRMDNAVYSVVDAAVRGAFDGGDLYVGILENEGVGLAPFHDYEDQIPDYIKQDVEEIVQDIIEGTIAPGD